MDAGYYAVIPADVRYDPELRPNAKLLYGELTSLCNKTGYCWATNEYFAGLYGLSAATISRAISQLEKRGYIRCEMAATEKGSERRIYAGLFLVRREIGDEDANAPDGERAGGVMTKTSTPLPAEIPEGGHDKNVNTPVDENVKGGIDENVKQNNTSMNNKTDNTPYSPPAGDKPAGRKTRRRKVKSEPDWNPHRFEQFWNYYGLKVDRVRAVAEWDALKPDDALIDHMAHTLRRQKNSELWRRGIGIPHPARWLRNRRWEDEDVGPREQPPPEDSGGWADDPEVTE